jgi:hypothetical protein
MPLVPAPRCDWNAKYTGLQHVALCAHVQQTPNGRDWCSDRAGLTTNAHELRRVLCDARQARVVELEQCAPLGCRHPDRRSIGSGKAEVTQAPGQKQPREGVPCFHGSPRKQRRVPTGRTSWSRSTVVQHLIASLELARLVEQGLRDS